MPEVKIDREGVELSYTRGARKLLELYTVKQAAFHAHGAAQKAHNAANAAFNEYQKKLAGLVGPLDEVDIVVTFPGGEAVTFRKGIGATVGGVLIAEKEE